MATARSSAKINGSSKDAAAELVARIDTLRKDLDALAGSVRNASDAVADDVRESAAERLDALFSAGERLVLESRETLKRQGIDAENKIRERPLAAVGVALAAGYIAAVILGRR